MKARLVADLSEAKYLASPQLGSSDIKALLESPLAFRWAKDHNSPPTDAQRFGSLVHALALGGVEVVVVDAKDWRTNDAKAARADAEERGAIAVLPHVRDEAMVLVNRLHDHKLAGPLLQQEGHKEASAFWANPATGVECRARFDVLPTAAKGRPKVVDLKTAANANPRDWIKDAGKYGYHLQDDHYSEGAGALGLENPAFLFVVISKQPPHDIAVIELTAIDKDLAKRQRAHALRRYADCAAREEWPGIEPVVHHPDLPPFYTYPAEEALQ